MKTIVIGRIRLLDLDRKTGRILARDAEHSTGATAVEFKFTASAYPALDIKAAFSRDLLVALVINDEGYVHTIHRATQDGFED